MNDPKIVLTTDDLPRQWYNLAADLPGGPLPPLGPDGQPIGPDSLAPVFPMNLIEQEVSTQRWIDIPEGILEILARWRPTPLRRALALEKALGTPAKIFYKDESVSPPGSHKPNTAVAQAWYNKEFGIKRLTTETGAGQWGSALAYAGQLLGLEVDVWMVRVSFDQKPFRKTMMETWGARCVPSPSPETQAGRAILEQDPDTPGSLGIAISEAIEAAVLFARTEGIIPAPETSHAILAVIDEARKAAEEGKEKVILFNFSGHGLMDLAGYQAYFAGKLDNYPLPPEVLERSLSVLEDLPKPPG